MADFLAPPARQQPGKLTVVFSTYHSLHVVKKAQELTPKAKFALVICDEAHKTAVYEQDNLDAEQSFGNIHQPNYIRTARVLFTTATPKVYAPTTREEYEKTNKTVASMDSREKFGPTFYELNFRAAVKKGILADYKIIIRPETRRVDTATKGPAAETEFMKKILAVHKALAGSGGAATAENYHPPKKTALIFSNTIAMSKKIQRRYTTALTKIIPKLPDKTLRDYRAEIRHLDCTSDAHERAQALQRLENVSPEQPAQIITNARVLSEGIDMPDLDAIIFFEGRSSQIDIAQAVGRCMRKGRGDKKFGYVILPVPVDEKMLATGELGDVKEWGHVWKALDALKSHDEDFDIKLNRLNTTTGRGQQKILVDLPVAPTGVSYNLAAFKKNLKVKLLTRVGVQKMDLQDLGEIDQSTKNRVGIVSAAQFAKFTLGARATRAAIATQLAQSRIGVGRSVSAGTVRPPPRRKTLTKGNVYHAYQRTHKEAIFQQRCTHHPKRLGYRVDVTPDVLDTGRVLRIKLVKNSTGAPPAPTEVEQWALLYQMYVAQAHKTGVIVGYEAGGRITYDTITHEYTPAEARKIYKKIESALPKLEAQVRRQMEELIKTKAQEEAKDTEELLEKFNAEYRRIYERHLPQPARRSKIPATHQYKIAALDAPRPATAVEESRPRPERPAPQKIDYEFLAAQRPEPPRGRTGSSEAYARSLQLWEEIKQEQIKQAQEQTAAALRAYHQELMHWHSQQDAARHALQGAPRRERETVEKFSAGEVEIVNDYCAAVYQQQRFPTNYGKVTASAYDEAARTLTLAFDYISPNELYKANRIAKGDNQQYKILAAYAWLLQVKGVWAADHKELIERIRFTGHTGIFQSWRGANKRVCLLTAEITRADFQELALKKLDPLACVQHFGQILASVNITQRTKTLKPWPTPAK